MHSVTQNAHFAPTSIVLYHFYHHQEVVKPQADTPDTHTPADTHTSHHTPADIPPATLYQQIPPATAYPLSVTTNPIR